MNRKLEVLLYVPNIIGYARLVFILIAWHNFHKPFVFLLLYCNSAFLDGVDGWAARKLNQVSDFGAWLDVVVDIVGRGMIWCSLGFKWLAEKPTTFEIVTVLENLLELLRQYGYLVPAWEWMVFVCNHARADTGQWRQQFKTAPALVKRVMDHGFKTLLGMIAIIGIHVLPIWLYVEYSIPKSTWLSNSMDFILFWGLASGRLLGFIVEFWCVYIHICYLLESKEYTKKH